MARVGLLTGGGDCPGLNAVIRAAVRRGLADGEHSFVGFRYGWAGVLEDDAIDLTLQSTSGILPRGGTILGTSRTNPFADGRDAVAAIRATMQCTCRGRAHSDRRRGHARRRVVPARTGHPL